MRINSCITIRAPREQVWKQITDPAAYLEFMSGITRWELQGDGGVVEAPGSLELGSRIRMLIRVGSAEVGGLIEIVECSERSDMAWSSVTGIDQRGRWRLREAGNGSTRVELRFSYGVAGAGIGGLLAERVGAPIMRRHLRSSLHELKKVTEREYRLRDAAAKRERAAV
ncbi:MAG: SRPBCC family protein [Solirubrobacterales bacterium]